MSEINNNISSTYTQPVPASSGSSSSSVNSSTGTIFNEKAEVKTIKKVVLTEVEIAFIIASGKNPEEMTQKDIEFLLCQMPKNYAPQKKETVPAEPTSAMQDEKPAVEVKAPVIDSSVTNTPAKVPQNAPEGTESAVVRNAEAEQPIAVIDPDVKKKLAEEFAAKLRQNLEKDKFHQMPTEAKKDYLLTEYAKMKFGDRWGGFTDNRKARILKSLEKDMTTELVPDWNKKTDAEKAAITDKAVTYMEVFIESGLTAEEFMKLTNEQRDKLVSEHSAEAPDGSRCLSKTVMGINEKEDKELYLRVVKAQGYESIQQADQSNTGMVSEMVYNHLENLLKENGNDIEKFSAAEKRSYNDLTLLKEKAGGNFENLGGHAQVIDSSTFNKMRDDKDFISNIKGVNYRSDEYYQAIAGYINAQTANMSPEKKQEFLSTLGENCEFDSQKLDIYNAAKYLSEDDAKITTKGSVAFALATVEGQSDGTQLQTVESVKEAYEKGTYSEDAVVAVMQTDIKDLNKVVQADAAIILNQTGSEKVQKASIPTVNTFETKDQEKVYNDVYTNNGVTKDGKPIYSENTQVAYAENTHNLKKEIQVTATKMAVKTGKVRVATAAAGTISKQDKDNQLASTKVLMDSTFKFSDEDAIKIEKSIADQIELSHKDNQLDMHKMVLTSKHEEVLERASSNINKYDKSVQAEAIKASYNTGNEKAIEATVAQLDKCSESAVQAVAAESAPHIAAIEEKNAIKTANVVADSLYEYNKYNNSEPLDEKAQKEVYAKEFLKASPQEQYKMLSKLPQSMQGTALTMICRYCPNMLAGLVKQGYGKQILKTPGMSSEVVYKVVNVMFESQNSDKVEAAKYVTDHKTLFAKSTTEHAEEIMEYAAVKKNKKTQNSEYASKPEFFKDALKPGMSAVYPKVEKMFYKG